MNLDEKNMKEVKDCYAEDCSFKLEYDSLKNQNHGGKNNDCFSFKKFIKKSYVKETIHLISNEYLKKGGSSNIFVYHYYVQVIDANNNVLGEKKSESFGAQTLTYSFTTNVKYENKIITS